MSRPELALRWGLTHGLVRRAVARRIARGDQDTSVPLEPSALAAPWDYYRALRGYRPFAPGPVARIAAHHDLCTTILRSDDFGVSRRDKLLPRPVVGALRVLGPRRYSAIDDPPSMLAVDPPDHARYRRLVSRAFTAKSVAALRERTEEIARSLLDELEPELRAGNDVDLGTRYAAVVPLTVIADMLGVPPAMRSTLLEWGDGVAAGLDLGLPFDRYVRAERSLAAFDAWLRAHVRNLRAAPSETLLSRLVAVVDDDGSGLSERELVTTAMLVLAAGFETSVNLIANGAMLLFEHPEQRATLAADPSWWPNAVDEVLRFDSPVQRTARQARRDTEVEGVAIARGEMVVAMLGAANRDPAVFDDPERFDVTRPEAKDHVGFSSGIHYCLGAALARMEGEVALRALFTRFPNLVCAGETVRRPMLVMRGYATVPVGLRTTDGR